MSTWVMAAKEKTKVQLCHQSDFLHNHYLFESVYDENHYGVVRISIHLHWVLKPTLHYMEQFPLPGLEPTFWIWLVIVSHRYWWLTWCINLPLGISLQLLQVQLLLPSYETLSPCQCGTEEAQCLPRPCGGLQNCIGSLQEKKFFFLIWVPV